MPPKQPTCAVCGHKLQKVGETYGHKKKEHWTASPHKARPVFEKV